MGFPKARYGRAPDSCALSARHWMSAFVMNTHTEYATKYIGHDEPAINFYSNVPGSGNSSVYLLTLPLDPAKPPVQNGGGTYNFELHPAFWFGGMNICDTQSYP